MRLHEIADASEYLLTGRAADAVTDELLDTARNIQASQCPGSSPIKRRPASAHWRGDCQQGLALSREGAVTGLEPPPICFGDR
jgi:hypothetical protein